MRQRQMCWKFDCYITASAVKCQKTLIVAQFSLKWLDYKNDTINRICAMCILNSVSQKKGRWNLPLTHGCTGASASRRFTFLSSFLFLLLAAIAPSHPSQHSSAVDFPFTPLLNHFLSAAHPQYVVTVLKTLSSYFCVSCVSCGGSSR